MARILKNLIVIMVIAVVIAGGYFLYQLYQNGQLGSVPAPNNENPGTTDGTTPNDDIEDTSEVISSKTVFDLISEDEDLSIITELIEVADLESRLAGNNKLTLFLPSNDALNAAYTPQQLADLATEENRSALIDLLENHIVDDEYTGAELFNVGNTTLKSQQDEDLSISNDDGTLFVNDIEILEIDLRGKNGVVHTIKGILAVEEDSETEQTETQDEEEDTEETEETNTTDEE